jgi:hypothetical protein
MYPLKTLFLDLQFIWEMLNSGCIFAGPHRIRAWSRLMSSIVLRKEFYQLFHYSL